MRKGLCQYAYDRCCYLRTCDFQIYIHICIMPQFSLPKKEKKKPEWGTMFFPRVFIMEEVYSMSISVCHMESLSNYTFNWCGCPRWTWQVLSWTSQWVKFCPHCWTMAKLGVTLVRDCTLLMKLSCWVKWTTHRQYEYISLSLVDS